MKKNVSVSNNDSISGLFLGDRSLEKGLSNDKGKSISKKKDKNVTIIVRKGNGNEIVLDSELKICLS